MAPSMQILVIGFNYKNTPLSFRETLAFDRDAAISLSRALNDNEVIGETMVLSTCNRTEIYCVGSCREGIKTTVYQLLAEGHSGSKLNLLKRYSYFYEDADALLHMFRVASSLDAMIVGETQILGQFKDAYQAAVECGTVGPYLHKACHAAFRVAKRIRTETGIAKFPVSIGTLSAELFERSYGDLKNAKALIIGAGEMGSLCAGHIRKRACENIFIANRSPEGASQLACEIGGAVVPFESWPEYIQKVDIVLTSIGGGLLIKKSGLGQAMAARGHKHLIIIDLAVPRNVEESARGIQGLDLYNIDDLQELAGRNMDARKEAAGRAEAIALEESRNSFLELEQIKLAPLLDDLHKKCRAIVEEELVKLYSRNKDFTDQEKEMVKDCLESAVKKILHDPIKAVKEILVLQ